MMIENDYLKVLKKIAIRLKNNSFPWVVTGSFGMALQGISLEIHDIDIQTDKYGAYRFENCFDDFVVQPVRYLESERIRSFFGILEIDGIKVEIMGDIQKLLDRQIWEEPIEIEGHRRYIEADGMLFPVLSLEYEYQAYLKLGRVEKAEMLRNWLQKTDAGE